LATCTLSISSSCRQENCPLTRPFGTRDIQDIAKLIPLLSAISSVFFFPRSWTHLPPLNGARTKLKLDDFFGAIFFSFFSFSLFPFYSALFYSFFSFAVYPGIFIPSLPTNPKLQYDGLCSAITGPPDDPITIHNKTKKQTKKNKQKENQNKKTNKKKKKTKQGA
jgi:hypothetical protein